MVENANSDELSAFVSSTLRAIAAGISDAQEMQITSAHGTGVSGYTAPTQVEFDIAVSAKSTDSVGGGFKVAVFGIGANAEGKLGTESATVSRIRFSVPMRFRTTARETGADGENWKTV